jgi:hypothetical protein
MKIMPMSSRTQNLALAGIAVTVMDVLEDIMRLMINAKDINESALDQARMVANNMRAILFVAAVVSGVCDRAHAVEDAPQADAVAPPETQQSILPARKKRKPPRSVPHAKQGEEESIASLNGRALNEIDKNERQFIELKNRLGSLCKNIKAMLISNEFDSEFPELASLKDSMRNNIHAAETSAANLQEKFTHLIASERNKARNEREYKHPVQEFNSQKEVILKSINSLQEEQANLSSVIAKIRERVNHQRQFEVKSVSTVESSVRHRPHLIAARIEDAVVSSSPSPSTTAAIAKTITPVSNGKPAAVIPLCQSIATSSSMHVQEGKKNKKTSLPPTKMSLALFKASGKGSPRAAMEECFAQLRSLHARYKDQDVSGLIYPEQLAIKLSAMRLMKQACVAALKLPECKKESRLATFIQEFRHESKKHGIFMVNADLVFNGIPYFIAHLQKISGTLPYLVSPEEKPIAFVTQLTNNSLRITNNDMDEHEVYWVFQQLQKDAQLLQANISDQALLAYALECLFCEFGEFHYNFLNGKIINFLRACQKFNSHDGHKLVDAKSNVMIPDVSTLVTLCMEIDFARLGVTQPANINDRPGNVLSVIADCLAASKKDEGINFVVPSTPFKAAARY